MKNFLKILFGLDTKEILQLKYEAEIARVHNEIHRAALQDANSIAWSGPEQSASGVL